MTRSTKTTRGGVIAAAAACALAPVAAGAQDLRIATGAQGGQWYPLGGALKTELEERNPEMSLQVLPGGGVSNVISVDRGQADLGITFNVSSVDGLRGAEPFPAPTTDVCHLATLFPSFYQIVTVVAGDVNGLDDIKGRSLTTSSRGSTTEGINRQLLGTLGLSYEDLGRTSFTSFTDSVALMKDGNADVFIVGTSVPTAAVMDLASARDIQLLPIPPETMARMQQINPGYIAGTIPAGTYPGQVEDVPAIEFATQIIVRCSLDDAAVTAVAQALHEGLDDLVSVNAGLRGLGPDAFGRDVGLPPHPAAEAYWAEAR